MSQTSPDTHYDALVIGAGAGGLCAAARLAHHGRRVLLVDERERVGGRASSVTEDGYTINTGAIAIEYGGVLEQTFTEVGAPFDIRVPVPATMFRIKGKDLDISKGGWGKLINGITKKGAGLLNSLGDARKGRMPDDALTVDQWLRGYTKNKTIHALFRNLCAAIFAVNASEMPATAFLTYFFEKGAFKDYGFSPTGTLGVMQGLADVVTDRGGSVQLLTRVEALHVDDGRVTGAALAGPSGTQEVTAGVVISNAGPSATARLVGREHLSPEYLERLDSDLKPTANIVVNFSSDVPLTDVPGILTFGITRRLCNMANLTATCPELAPDGKHLYVAYGVPIPAVGDFDEDAEVAATLEDLRDEFPGFDQEATIISIKVMRGEWPAQRSIAGYDLPQETTLPNLFNVGDGVREFANGGVQACAETAKLVVDKVLADRAEPVATS